MTDQPTPLTEQQLHEIEASAAAATPGPWGAYQYGGDSLIEVAADLQDTGTGYRARRTVARFDEEPLDNDPTHREWTADEDWAQVQADAAYIAAMPPEVATALVAEVRRLRAELTEYEVLNPQQCPAGTHADWLVDSEHAHACPWCENERLRARVAELEGGANGPDTLPAWLHWRFGPHGQPWSDVPAEDQALWEHQARAVRRAVARGGFKPRPAASAVSGAADSRPA